MPAFKIYTLYERPDDYPQEYVVRGTTILPGETIQDPEIYLKHESLEVIQEAMERLGLAFIYRSPEDAPSVMGCYL